MGKLMLTCHKCGFVAAIDSREVALMSGWTFSSSMKSRATSLAAQLAGLTVSARRRQPIGVLRSPSPPRPQPTAARLQ